LSPCRFFFFRAALVAFSTPSLHDALPIWRGVEVVDAADRAQGLGDGSRGARRGGEHHPAPRSPLRFAGGGVHRLVRVPGGHRRTDRKSTRLNSSHVKISYAVFCFEN